MTPSFLREMEENLVRAYLAGKAEQDQRNQEIQTLLDDLNPDDDPLMNKRKRRAVTIDDITAQVRFQLLGCSLLLKVKWIKNGSRSSF